MENPYNSFNFEGNVHFMTSIDINADVGEGESTSLAKAEKELMKYVSSINIACGFHAGSPVLMMETVICALKNQVAIGAHPGYPDREGFGRHSMAVSNEELFALVIYQVGALKAMVEARGGTLHHVKPHGALYNDLAKNFQKALVVAEAIKKVDKKLIFVGLANSDMIAAGKKAGLTTMEEIFADRGYNEHGSLLPRTQPGAVFNNAPQGVLQVKTLVNDGYLTSVKGTKLFLNAETICVHGDNSKALEFVRLIHETLTNKGIKIKAAHE